MLTVKRSLFPMGQGLKKTLLVERGDWTASLCGAFGEISALS